MHDSFKIFEYYKKLVTALFDYILLRDDKYLINFFIVSFPFRKERRSIVNQK